MYVVLTIFSHFSDFIILDICFLVLVYHVHYVRNS